jgi:hypothetical protein
MMQRILLYSLLSVLCLGLAASANAQAQSVVSAGTLLQCTLDEPNFSSATASVGDPVVCYLKSVQQFGHIVLPRGSYLEGHLAAEKDPGHFWGKGYLRLEFDRIGLPSTDIPVPSKVIAASGGYKTDRQGDVVGKGHAARDVVEWLLPPLWPWKMITLPARGPRPTFKGEELLTLRLMDDVVVPKVADIRPTAAPGWHYFGDPSGQYQSRPMSYNSPQSMFTPASLSTAADPGASAVPARRITMIALKSDEVFGVTSYRIEDGRLNYTLLNGETGSAEVGEVDWTRTSQINTARVGTGTIETRMY